MSVFLLYVCLICLPQIRSAFTQIKSRLNVQEIHLRKITDFHRRAYITRELNKENFTYINIIADTNKIALSQLPTSELVYNYLCRMLLERVSWFLRDTGRVADIVLSVRGTSRDNELIDYIKDKLLPYQQNQIASNVFEKITAKTAGTWELLQLADVCATTMFLTYEVNGWGFCTPCFSKVLKNHLYTHHGEQVENYGIKYFKPDMKPNPQMLKCNWACK